MPCLAFTKETIAMITINRHVWYPCHIDTRPRDGIEIDCHAAGVIGPDHLRNRVGQRVEARLRFAERHQHTGDGSRRILQRRDDRVNQACAWTP